MPQNNKSIIAHRRARVSELYLKGLGQIFIAEKLKKEGFAVSQSQVSRDLKKLREAWIKSSKQDINEIIGRELAKIDTIELEYWAAWERSKKDYTQKASKVKGSKKAPSSIEKQEKEIMQYGDPSYLRGVERCIDQRAKLLGLNAPEKRDITTKGERINDIDVGKLEADEKIELFSLMQKAKNNDK